MNYQASVSSIFAIFSDTLREVGARTYIGWVGGKKSSRTPAQTNDQRKVKYDLLLVEDSVAQFIPLSTCMPKEGKSEEGKLSLVTLNLAFFNQMCY